MRIALIHGGLVSNVIEAESVAAATALLPDMLCVAADNAGPGWHYSAATGLTPPQPEQPGITSRRATAVAQIEAAKQQTLALGAPYAGRRISVDDQGRADLAGLATTAGLVLTGALPEWPESYALGWIAVDNARIPLPSPADGVMLAATCGDWYARVIQYARDRKDLALATAEPEAVVTACDWAAFDPA